MDPLSIAFWLYRWIKLLVWLFVCLLMFELSRVLMFLYHFNYFKLLNFSDLISIFIGGMRFDLVSVVISNIFLIVLLLVPVNFKNYEWLKGIINFNWIVFTVFLLFNFIDIPYFSYIHKRSTADIFYQLGGQTDVIKQLPQYLTDFWWLFLLFMILIFIHFKVYKKILFYPMMKRDFSYPWNKKNAVLFFINLWISILLCVIAIRGGFQRIPLDIVDAAFYTQAPYTSLVLNTPFSIIKSIEQKQLPEYHFYNNNKITKDLNLYKHYAFNRMTKKNIVLIILESFSKEYTALGNKPSFTPFLDSLMQHAIVFENAYSNGTKSIEGIPAILSSIPSWMDNSFINSLYCNNTIVSFPILLKKEGYYTAFFHGGINGTMNFDAYSNHAQFDAYFGKNEYPNDKDFDGYWGIWDEPFLEFTAKKITEFSPPFFISIFTLSSHHPFHVPEKYQSILPKGNLPIQQSIAYTDMSLQKFFLEIKKSSWYKNTLFIITADHTGISEDPYYSSIAGRYQIPIIIFNPSDSSYNIQQHIIQQIDILPTTLCLLKYPHHFFSFGNNYFDTQQHHAVFYESGYYYLADDSLLYSFKNFHMEKCWKYKNQLKEEPSDNTIKKLKEEQIKRIIQGYNNTLIHNSIHSYQP